jgi:hypothetical protein
MIEFFWWIMFILVICTIGLGVSTFFEGDEQYKKFRKNNPKKTQENSGEEWRNDPRFK